MNSFRFLIGFLIPSASAQVVSNIGNSNQGVKSMWQTVCATVPFCGVGRNAPALIYTKVTHVLLLFIGGVAVAVLIYAGIKLTISRGNDEGITDAKKIAMYAIGGLILAAIADAVVLYVIALTNAAAV